MKQPVKILIIEDSEDDAKLALRALCRGGFDPTHRRIQTAAELESALAQERWDAVISDFMLPGFTGIDALGIFRAAGLDIPFILVSGTIGEESAVNAMTAGASDYVMKNNLARLAPALERELKETAMRAAHRQATEALRRSESLKGAILESSLDCVVTIDHEGKIVEFNPASERTFGFTREQALGKLMVELIVPPRLRDAHRRGFAHYLATGKGPFLDKRLELEAIRADGTEFPIELAITAIAATPTPMFTGFIRDISDRKRAEVSMAEVQAQYRQLVELSPDAIHIHQGGKYVFVNSAALRLFGAESPEQLLGRSVLDFIHPDQRITVRERMRIQYEEKRVIPGMEQKALRLDGSVIDVEIKSAPFTFEGRPAIQSVVRDITGRKRAEEELRQFRTAMDISPDLILLIDRASMRFVDVNDTACRVLGYRRDELLTKGPDDVASESREELARLYDRVIAGDSSVATVEMHHRRKDGSLVPVELFRRAVPSRDGHIIVIIARDITERKRAAEAMQTSEQEQRQLAENLELERSRLVAAQQVAKVGSWETDLATMSVLWSDETHRIHETDPATFRPTHSGFLEFVHPEDRARVDEAFWRSLGERAAYKKIEHRLLLPDGRIKFVEERWRVYFDKQKKPVRAVGTCQDITGRKKIESEIHETRNFLASIFDNIPISIFVKDARDLTFVRANAACETLTGYSEEELLGKSDYDFFPKDQADFFVAKDRETLAGKQRVFIIEETLTSRDGTQKILQTKQLPILDKDGQPQYILAMSEDITKRKQSERLLGESETKYRDLIEQADDGISLSDAQGNFLMVNSRGCELLGYSKDQLLGMNGRLTYPEEERAIHTQRMLTVATGKHLRFERMVKRQDGSTFPAEISLKMIDNSMVQIIFHDITDRREAENRIKRLMRVYAVLSGINALIVRVRDRNELFKEACRIAVDAGAFKMAWIGVIDPHNLDGEVVAWHGGEEGYIDKVRLTARDGTPYSERPACRALREAQPVICNDIATDLSLGSLRDDLLTRGHKSAAYFPLTVTGRPEAVIALFAGETNVFDDEETRLLLDLASDISFAIDHIEKQVRLDYLAYYDVLTGLANRSLFLERVSQYMRSAVSAGHKLAMYLIDLERFKNINDSLGQPAGDALLRQVAGWLMRNAGDANLVARVGADHFAVVLPEVRQESDVARVIETTMESFLDHPFHLMDSIFRVAAKVGVAMYPDDGSDADMVFRNAEAALKKAKASGDRYLFFTQKMTEMVAVKLTLENQLRQALDNEEFVLHYQPKVNLASGKLTSAEALIRWNDPRTGLVPPARFIPILEETGLIYDVGRWALRKAIEDYLRWRRAGLAAVRIAVNVSPLQLRNRGFAAEIEQAIGVDAAAAAGLELEITESLIMEDVKHNIATLQAIRAMGVSIAIDDFGTGFSSLSYLAKLPVDTLKIDRSFVVDMAAAQEALALVSTIISLAHSMKLKVVAEGVETEEQSRLLRLLNCDEMQGYLFSKPVPCEIFETKFLALPPAARRELMRVRT